MPFKLLGAGNILLEATEGILQRLKSVYARSILQKSENVKSIL